MNNLSSNETFSITRCRNRFLIEATVERAAIAIEGARLLDEAQKRAARETFLSEIGSKLGASFQLINSSAPLLEKNDGNDEK